MNQAPIKPRRIANTGTTIRLAAGTKKIDSLSPDLVERLFHYSFPGNARELENIIAEAVLLEKGNSLTLVSAPTLAPSLDDTVPPETDLLSLAEMEKHHIERVLKSTGGNRTKAAKILGIGLRALQRKLKEFSAQDLLQE